MNMGRLPSSATQRVILSTSTTINTRRGNPIKHMRVCRDGDDGSTTMKDERTGSG
jgi:hypothetical protein